MARALSIVGDQWTLLLLYYVFLGVRRFGTLQAMSGMARSVLVNRLRRLERGGLLRRVRYQARPARHEYRLTAMSRDLYDVALAIIRWDKRWHYDPACPPHRIVHRACGREFTPELRCAACHAPVTAREVMWEPGPGAGFDPTPHPRAHRRATVPMHTLRPPHPIMERSFETLGDRWTSLVIAAAFYRKRRFHEFQSMLGIATNVLSDRLARLVKHGVLERHEAGARPEYRLTPEGLDLFPIVLTLLRWGDRWLAGRKGPPLLLRHLACGARLRTYISCDRCAGALSATDFTLSEEARRRLWRPA